MSLSEGRLTEASGMRGLEGTANRVREDYGYTPPTGPAWTYDFTTMADGPQPATLIAMSGGIDAVIVSGGWECGVDWFFSRSIDTLAPDQVSPTHLLAVLVGFKTTSGSIQMRFAQNAGADLGAATYNGIEIAQNGNWNGQYQSGGDGGGGNLGAAFTIGTPYKIHITYDEVSGASELFVDGVSKLTSGYSNKQTGVRSSLQITGNLDFHVFKWYYGPQSAGVPT